MKVTSTLKESPFRLDKIFLIYRYFTPVSFSHNRRPVSSIWLAPVCRAGSKGLNNSIIPSATLLKRVRFNSYSDFVHADWRVGIINKWTDRDNVFSLTWPHRFCLVDILSDHGEKTDCCGMQDLHRVWKSSVEEAELKRALLLGCLWQANQVFGGKSSPTKKVKMTDA